MINLILGLTGTGKTHTIKEEIRKKVENGEKVLYIVPEKINFSSEQMFFDEFSGSAYHNIEILSFDRLSNFIFRILGGMSKQIYKKEEKLLKIFWAIKKNKDNFTLYKKQVGKEKFSYKTLELIKELKGLLIYPEDLQAIIEKVKDKNFTLKMKELLLIYSDYEQSLDEDYADSDDNIKRAMDLVNGTDFFAGYHIYLDNFTMFSNKEYKMIRQMLNANSSFTVSLALEHISNNNIYLNGIEKTVKSIINLAKEMGHRVATTNLNDMHRYRNDDLKNTNLYLSENKKIKGALSNVNVYNGENKYDTVRYISSYIKNLVQNGDCRYKDIAVVTREYGEYKLPIKKLFRDYNIPVFLNEESRILDKPIISLIYNLMKVLTSNFGVAYIINYLQSPFVNANEEDVFLFLDYLYVWNIDTHVFKKEFTKNPKGYLPKMSEDERETLSKIEGIRRRYVEPLIKLQKDMNKNTCGVMVKTLYEFVEQLNIKDGINDIDFDSMIDCTLEEMWNIFIDVLDIIYSSQSEGILTIKEFEEVFLLVCKSYTVKKIPQKQDEVLFSDIGEVFLLSPKVVIVLGANSNSFPKTKNVDGILTNNDRQHFIDAGAEEMNNNISSVVNEYYLCYKAMTAPSERLILTYESYKVNGEEQQASDIVKDILRITGKSVLTKNSYDDDYFIYNNGTAFLTFCDMYDKTGVFKDSLKEFLKITGEYEEYIDKLAFFIEPSKYFLRNKNVIDMVYKDNLLFSPSQIDKIRKCRFLHFLSNGLKLYARTRAEISYSDIGNLVHYISDNVVKNLSDNFYTADKKVLDSEVERMSVDFIKENYGDNRLDYEYKYLLDEIKKDAKELVLQIQKEINLGEYKIYKTELKIGGDSDFKGYEKVLGGRNVKIQGIVDRVDIFEDDDNRYIRVIDYKTSNKEFNYGNFYEGVDMQLLIYLFALANNNGGNEKNIVASAGFYMPSRIEATDINESGIDEQFKFSGIILDDFLSRKAVGNLDNSYMSKCFKFVKKYGLCKGEGLVTKDEMNVLEQHIDTVIVDIVKNINDGDIRSIPMSEQGKKSCSFCDYKFVCKFEEDIDEIKEKSKYNKSGIFKKLLGEEDEE